MRFSRARSPLPLGATNLSRFAVFVLLLAYVAVVVAAYYATLRPGELGLRLKPCEDSFCVSWVMPASQAWSQGARPGMEVLSVDGQALPGADTGIQSPKPRTQAVVRTSEGNELRVEVLRHAIGQSPMKFSLWTLGGLFALLGSAVVIRRPDLRAARMFGLFAGITAIGMAVGPASGGPQLKWALDGTAIYNGGNWLILPSLCSLSVCR